MKTLLPLIAALPLALGAPAYAQPRAGYVATPVAAPADGTLITRNTLWRCTGGTCLAGKPSGSPMTMCQLVVRETGALSGFTANGSAFDAAALEKCNARAK